MTGFKCRNDHNEKAKLKCTACKTPTECSSAAKQWPHKCVRALAINVTSISTVKLAMTITSKIEIA
jgi:hypothetical protein